MSAEQREALQALLDDIFDNFTSEVAASLGRPDGDVEDLIDRALYKCEELQEQGWITDLKYKDDIQEMLKKRTGGGPSEARITSLAKYAKVPRGATLKRPDAPRGEGEAGDGGAEAERKAKAKKAPKRIGVIRASGNIVRGASARAGQISAPGFIKTLRKALKDKSIAAVVLRVDSPGGDALASDLMWKEIRELGKVKPIVASMSDVAASGGYYMSMGCEKIVAEPLTLTGSIGVITAKFNLGELYEKVGFHKEILSKGKMAELSADNRPFTEEEEAYFASSARNAYESFRDKAALSRGMAPEEMEKYAQGRVWTGRRAKEVGLVDELGGIGTAIREAKKLAGLDEAALAPLVELSRPPRPFPVGALSGAVAAWDALQVLLRAGEALSDAAALLPAEEPKAVCDVSLKVLGRPYL